MEQQSLQIGIGMTQYLHPAGTEIRDLGERSLLTLPQGGRIALDPLLISLWQLADGQGITEILNSFRPEGSTPDQVRAALACLCEAGLLDRAEDQPVEVEQTEVSTAPQQVSISVVIVSYNSRDWLAECLPSLTEQTLCPIEIIIVDNGSTEDPGPWLAEHHPQVIFRWLDIPRSLAGALNLGVEVATGEYFLLLNPDTRLEADALAQMLAVAQSQPDCGAVAPLLKFTWAPAFLNGLGNYAGAFSWGTDHALGHLDLGQFEGTSEVPSACFAAALIPRSAWEAIGPLDEGFPLYYEDIEWSYRARLLGYPILAAPQAVIYHAYGSRVPSGEDNTLSATKLANVTYGRLRFATKILSGWRSVAFILSYALDDLARGFFGLVTGKPDKFHAYVRGWRWFWRMRPQIREQRAALQRQRVLDDRSLLAQQKTFPDPLIWRGLPALTWDSVVSHYLPLIKSGQTRPLPEFETVQPKFVIVSNEVIDAKLAGPGMRYLEMARALRDEVDITLAIPGETTLEEPGLSFAAYTETRPAELRALIEAHDVALVTAFTLNKFPFLNQVSTRLVVDLYDPFIFENFYYYLDEALSVQADISRQAVDLLNRVACLGDFFICGSERQRDLWLGLLMANQRVNPYTFAQDADLRALIDVVGIGFPDRQPVQRPFLRGTRPEFPEDCRIVLWGGGLWDWLDPLPLVQAWPQVIAAHPEARLVFLGTRHPNPDVPQHRVVKQLEALAEEIGERDRTIFFFEWLSYTDREALLSEADVGVTLHTMHIETHFSIRTRVLDYIWARLPILVSAGDVTSQWVQEYQLGCVVPPANPEQVAQALMELLSSQKQGWASAFDAIQQRFRWDEIVQPLRNYLLQGDLAPDHLAAGQRSTPQAATRRSVWQGRWARARFIWRTQGFRVLLGKVARGLRSHLTKMF